MNEIKKSALVAGQSLSEEDLAAINKHTLRPLTAEEIFAFKLAACNNQIDRDLDRFTEDCLEGLAKLYVGKPVLMDHEWSAGTQTARIYAAAVEDMPGVEGGRQLVLRCYMLRDEQTKGVVNALEAGILKECSVGCAVGRAACSICGKDRLLEICPHRKGETYDGKLCHTELDEPRDAYEASLVAVPVQPGAGVTKAKKTPPEPWTEKARQLLDLEAVRFGALRR